MQQMAQSRARAALGSSEEAAVQTLGIELAARAAGGGGRGAGATGGRAMVRPQQELLLMRARQMLGEQHTLS